MGANSRGGLLKTFCSRVGANSRGGLIRGGPIRGFTVLAKQKVRIRAQYGNLRELEIKRNISRDWLIGSRNNLWKWIKQQRRLLLWVISGFFRFFVKFTLSFCDAFIS